MSASYLRNFVDSVSELPAELQRCFGLMRHLDQQATAAQGRVDSAAEAALAAWQGRKSTGPVTKRQKTAEAPSTSQLQLLPDTLWDDNMEADSAQIQRLCAEKVALATQVYDYVDQRIRRLDKDMKAFDGEIARERAKLGLPELDTAVLAAEELAAAAPQKVGAATRGARRSQTATAVPDLGEVAQALADPSEPTYCVCNRVSFGEMIACDNPDCRIEWFHFECVGMRPDQPRAKGKWYCDECQALAKAKPKKKK